MSLISYKRGQGSIVLRVKIRNSSVSTGAGLSGLAYNSAGLIISTIADNEAAATTYTVAASKIETISTLGTFAAPTATKCRFKEVDATNHKGVYEIQIADARYGVANAKSLLVSVLGASNAAEVDAVIPLRDLDPYSNVVQEIAQVRERTGGVVHYIDKNGTDASDGLSPSTAKGSTDLILKTVIEAASAGDKVIVGPGVWALGDNVVNGPDGVNIYGAGMDVTRTTSTASLSAEGKGCILKPGSNSAIEDITIEGTLSDGTSQSPIGTIDTGFLDQATFVNAVARRCRFIADSDGVFLRNSSPANITLADCIIEAKYDGLATLEENNIIVAIRTQIIVTGPSATGSGKSRGVTAGPGEILCFDCDVQTIDGGINETIAYHCGTTGTIKAWGGSVYTSGGAGNVFDADNGGTLLMLSGVDYDRSKTNGTITQVSASEDIYHADIFLTRDAGNAQDEYTVVWYKNGTPLTGGITLPKIQVVKRADGENLVALTAMTQVGTTGTYKYDETAAANRLTAGEAAVALVTATIGGSSRTWRRPVGRDSA